MANFILPILLLKEPIEEGSESNDKVNKSEIESK